MIGLVRALNRHADIVGLLLTEFGKLGADLGEVKRSDFLV